MDRANPRLRVAVQKSGRLSEKSLDLLKESGFRIVGAKNALAARVENFPIEILFVRDDDIPTFVGNGACDFGVVGRNVLEEFALRGGGGFEIVAPLGFGKCALKIAGPEARAYDGPRTLAGAKIATSYPRITERFLKDNGVEAQVVRMNGAVELAPRLHIADYICDLVSTGATLEQNGLRPLETVLESEALLIRSQQTLDPALAPVAESMMARVGGVLATKESKYIMMNAPESALEQICAILPGAESPTVIPLAGRGGHVAVHAVCQESVFWETLQKLKAAGASAILVLPIEKMLM